MRRLMRRLVRRLRTGGAFRLTRRSVLVVVCIATSAALMISVLSGNARLEQGTRRAKSASATATAEPSVSLGANARHQSIFTAAPSTTKGFVTREYSDPSGASMVYYLYIPPAVSAEATAGRATRFPVVLLLHGIGESARASSTTEQNRDRILNDPYVNLWSSDKVQTTWPSFIIVPQAISPNRWVDAPPHLTSVNLSNTPAPELALAHEILQATLTQYARSVDLQRVYVTGISMGGYGAWDAIERWPDEFAAAAPLSGAGDPSMASAIANVPIWVFQGKEDQTLSIAASRLMVSAIIAAGGHPRLTLIPGANHVIWLRVYSNQTFLAWLFAQQAPA